MSYQKSKLIYKIGMLFYILAGFICVKFLYQEQLKNSLNKTELTEEQHIQIDTEYNIINKQEIMNTAENVNSYSYLYDVEIFYALDEGELLNISDEIIKDIKSKTISENKTLSNVQISFLLNNQVFYQLSY